MNSMHNCLRNESVDSVNDFFFLVLVVSVFFAINN